MKLAKKLLELEKQLSDGFDLSSFQQEWLINQFKAVLEAIEEYKGHCFNKTMGLSSRYHCRKRLFKALEEE